MNGLRDLARRRPVSTFYVLTLLYSWTLWALMLASARGWLPFPFATSWTGSFGPAAGAVVTALLLGGRAEVDRLLRPIGRWRFGRGLWLFVLAGSMAPFFAGLLAYVLGHGSGGGTAETLANLPLLALYYPVVLVLGGPLGEEIGWRGFALPRLVDRHGPALASLLVAAGWLTWHIPLFWLEGAAQKGGSLVLFALAVLALSFLFTGVFLESGGSLLAVLLLHTGINAPSLLVPRGAAFQEDPLAKGVELGLWLGLAGTVLLVRRRRFFPPGGRKATGAAAGNAAETG